MFRQVAKDIRVEEAKKLASSILSKSNLKYRLLVPYYIRLIY